MKTYEQVINQAVLVGFRSYFNGGSTYEGAHQYMSAVEFIYGVSGNDFINDIQRIVEDVHIQIVMNDWTADQTIEYLKTR